MASGDGSVIGFNQVPGEQQQTTGGVTILVQAGEQIARFVGRQIGPTPSVSPAAAPSAEQLAAGVVPLPAPVVLPMWSADP